MLVEEIIESMPDSISKQKLKYRILGREDRVWHGCIYGDIDIITLNKKVMRSLFHGQNHVPRGIGMKTINDFIYQCLENGINVSQDLLPRHVHKPIENQIIYNKKKQSLYSKCLCGEKIVASSWRRL